MLRTTKGFYRTTKKVQEDIGEKQGRQNKDIKPIGITM
ncbi:hypothetical protein THER_0983 [Thermodesulfovibrio sp. N1]|nr:hypothetical protein THER_0983 [Thermodesulfovibrio sp. N1]